MSLCNPNIESAGGRQFVAKANAKSGEVDERGSAVPTPSMYYTGNLVHVTGHASIPAIIDADPA